MNTARPTHPCPLCSAPVRNRIFTRKDNKYGVRRYFRCAECFLIFLDPSLLLTRDQEKEFYDLHENSIEDEGYRRHLNRLVEPLEKILKTEQMSIPAGTKTTHWQGIDYGCGPEPALAKMMDSLGYPTESFDPLYRPQNQLLGRSYKFVACSETAEHFFNPVEGFEKINRLLESNGGILGVMTHTYKKVKDFGPWYYHRDPTHVSFYHHKSMQWIADRFDWSVELASPRVYIFKKSQSRAAEARPC